MLSTRLLSSYAWAALVPLLLMSAAACGGGDDAADVTATETPFLTPTPTPFSLGNSLTIRGQLVTLPEGVAYINQTPDCQVEANASSDQCLKDLKMLVRGNSYILFDAATPRMIARLIEPEDEASLRPLLDIISDTAVGASPTSSPG